MVRVWRWIKRNEEGQSLVEVSVVSIFLILLGLMIFEAGVTFASYMALLNASREGAQYASAHPELVNAGEVPDDSSEYLHYTENVVKGEVQMGNMLDADKLTVHRPVLVDGRAYPNDPIRVQVEYRLYTFSSTIRLPFFGRFGLPDYWPLNAWTIMPLRR